jgi:hypothetical protein
MVQKKVVSGGKGIVRSNIWDEVISVLYLWEDCTLLTDHCALQWLLKLKRPDVPSGTSGTHRHSHCHIRP